MIYTTVNPRMLKIPLIQKLEEDKVHQQTIVYYGEEENSEHFNIFEPCSEIGRKIIDSLQKGEHEIKVLIIVGETISQ